MTQCPWFCCCLKPIEPDSNLYIYADDTGIFYGIKYYNDILREAGPQRGTCSQSWFFERTWAYLHWSRGVGCFRIKSISNGDKVYFKWGWVHDASSRFKSTPAKLCSCQSNFLFHSACVPGTDTATHQLIIPLDTLTSKRGFTTASEH